MNKSNEFLKFTQGSTPNIAALTLSRRHRISIEAAALVAEILGISGPAPDLWNTTATLRLAPEVRV